MQRQKIIRNFTAVSIAVLSAAHFLSIILLASVPPISVDALTYHLRVPGLYLEHGGMYEIPSNPLSYVPTNLGLLYMICLYFGNDIAPKFVHFFFALWTAWLIASYLGEKINKLYGAAGALFFLSIPIIVKLSITAYVDLGIICFSTLSLLQLLKWKEKGFRARNLVLSAVFAGLAAGTKYTGLIVIAGLAPLAIFLFFKGNRENPNRILKAAGMGIVFGFIAVTAVSPWLVRNAVWTGNPVYPTYEKIFNPENAQEKVPILTGTLFESRKDMFGESLPETLLLPIRIFFQGRDGNPRLFDGVLSPFLFLLPFLAFLKTKDRSIPEDDKYVFLYFALFILTYFLLNTNMTQVRLAGAMLPCLVILSVFGIRKIDSLTSAAETGIGKRTGAAAIILVSVGMIILHGGYIAGQFRFVRPFSYLSGEISREKYIELYRPEYPAIEYINRNLPETAKVMGVFLGYRGYYFRRAVFFWEMDPLFYAVIDSKTPEMLLESFRRDGADHMVIWFRYFEKWSAKNFEPHEIRNLKTFFDRHTKLLFSRNGYHVYRLSDI